MGSNHNRRGMLCSEILSIHCQAKGGRELEVKANLEEIWSSGALFMTDKRIQPSTPLWFTGGSCKFRGKVAARTFLRGLGYFIEMRFQPGCVWSEQQYRPRHLFNPLVLLANRIFEATLHAPSTACQGLLPGTFARPSAMASFKQATGQAF